ncbi:MAG: cytidine/deoxycytidylate deaminase family protein [Planctomycetota bacterium]|nr:cytidine/deoxycytidylate deaminase family protein [Planctomycetota bacterium]
MRSKQIKKERPSWDSYFLRIAQEVSRRATCIRRSVGALLVRDKHILSTGYNGPPSGLPHCTDIGCLREERKIPTGERQELCRGLHAEQNALLQAAIHGVSVKGSVLYCTSTPCSLCAKMLINAGVVRIVALEEYPDEFSNHLLYDTGIKVEILSLS